MTLSLRKVGIWLLLAVGISYLWSLQAPFHFDDSHSVESNLAIRSFSNLKAIWTDNATSSFIPENRVYRPLVYTFYSVCWWVGDGATWPFHLMKMIMHALVALGMFAVWRRLFRESSWFPVKALKIKIPLVSRSFSIDGEAAALLLAIIFAVHPAGSECAIYVSSTTSLQCGLFFIWAFYSYLLYRDSGVKKHLFFSLFLYFCSMASKEEGLTLVAVVFLVEFMLSGGHAGAFGKGLRDAFRRTLPVGIMAAALAGCWYAMHSSEGTESHGYVNPLHYFFTQWRAYLFYMRIWFWPFDLNADNTEFSFSTGFMDPRVIQAAIGNALLLWFTIAQRKRFPALFFGVAWFYITISPTSSFLPLAEAVNERRMYIPYFAFSGGTFAVILWACENFFSGETRARRLGWGLAVILFALYTGTYERNRVWGSSESLWKDTVEKNPTSGRALNNLGLVYMARGEYAESIKHFESCERHWYGYMYCPLNKGIALNGLQKYDEAEKSFQRAYQLNPRNVHVNFHLGNYFETQKKDFSKAAEYFITAVQLTGNRYPEADQRAAAMYANLARFEDARKSLKRALEIKPGDADILFQIARLEFDAKNVVGAREAYQALLQERPNHVQAWYNLGVLELQHGSVAEARKCFERTVAIDPKSEQGLYNLAFTAEKMNDGKGAVQAARKLAAVNPKSEYQLRLAALEKKFGAQ